MHCAQPDDCAFDGTTWECVFCGRKCGETMTSKSEMKAEDFDVCQLDPSWAARIANAKIEPLLAKLTLAEEALKDVLDSEHMDTCDLEKCGDDYECTCHIKKAGTALAELRKP